MRDYLGNEIKPGQTICKIYTKTFNPFSRYGIIWPNGKEVWTTPPPPEDCWRVGTHMAVSEVFNDYAWVKYRDEKYTIGCKIFASEYIDSPNTVLAIVGISDKPPVDIKKKPE